MRTDILPIIAIIAVAVGVFVIGYSHTLSPFFAQAGKCDGDVLMREAHYAAGSRELSVTVQNRASEALSLNVLLTYADGSKQGKVLKAPQIIVLSPKSAPETFTIRNVPSKPDEVTVWGISRPSCLPLTDSAHVA